MKTELEHIFFDGCDFCSSNEDNLDDVTGYLKSDLINRSMVTVESLLAIPSDEILEVLQDLYDKEEKAKANIKGIKYER